MHIGVSLVMIWVWTFDILYKQLLSGGIWLGKSMTLLL